MDLRDSLIERIIKLLVLLMQIAQVMSIHAVQHLVMLFQIASSTVSWCSKKQATVAKSTTEAEYVSLSLATQEAIWLRRLMNGMISPTLIYDDNQGAIQVLRNPKSQNRT